jgi:hypothetical protein
MRANRQNARLRERVAGRFGAVALGSKSVSAVFSGRIVTPTSAWSAPQDAHVAPTRLKRAWQALQAMQYRGETTLSPNSGSPSGGTRRPCGGLSEIGSSSVKPQISQKHPARGTLEARAYLDRGIRSAGLGRREAGRARRRRDVSSTSRLAGLSGPSYFFAFLACRFSFSVFWAFFFSPLFFVFLSFVAMPHLHVAAMRRSS